MNDFQLLIAGSSPAMCIEKEKEHEGRMIY